jgi:hypothetical protein
MRNLRTSTILAATLFALLVALPAYAVSNRIFMSTNGNNASDCANPLTPCLTFAGALAQVNPGGEVIAEATGGYGPLNITQAVTISGPPGVVIYSGLQVTVNASGATVVLRGLTIDGAGVSANGIEVQAVGTLSVENCVINAFGNFGIHMGVAGKLNIKNTDVKGCNIGVQIDNSSGTVSASIDHCHLDSNLAGFRAKTTAPGDSTTTATYSTANNNSGDGWIAGAGPSTGRDVLNIEFCTGSQNGVDGLAGNSSNASSVARFSNCVLANNGGSGVDRLNSGTFESRGNNTITGNTSGPTNGVIGSFSPM